MLAQITAEEQIRQVRRTTQQRPVLKRGAGLPPRPAWMEDDSVVSAQNLAAIQSAKMQARGRAQPATTLQEQTQRLEHDLKIGQHADIQAELDRLGGDDGGGS